MAILYTTGTEMYSDVGSPAVLDDVLPTLSGLALVRWDALSAGAVIMCKRLNGSTGAGWRFSAGSSGQLQFNKRYASDNVNYAESELLLSGTGVWRWVAFSFDEGAGAGVKVKLFGGNFAGTIAEASGYSASTDAASGANSDAAQPFRFGNYATPGTTSTPSGAIEYAAVWDEVLSAAQFQAHIDGTTHTSGLLGEWRLGWSGATTIDDISANNNDGTTTTAVNTAGIYQPRIVRAGFHHRNH